MASKQSYNTAFQLDGDLALERQVIHDAVCHAESIAEMLDIITPGMFSSLRLREVWELIVRRFNKGDDVNIVTIGTLSPTYVTDVLQQSPDEAGPMTCIMHARLLRNADCRRRAYNAAYDLLKDCTDKTRTEEEIIAAANHLKNVVEGDSPSLTEVPIQQAFRKMADEWERQETAAKEGRSVRVPTGFASIDTWLQGGFGPGQLVILAARPSVGKTAVMLHMARAAAAMRVPACIFSLEMTDEEIAQRMVFSTGKVDPFDIQFSHMDWPKIDEGIAVFNEYPILMNDRTRDLDGLVSRIVINAQRGTCGVAFVDYLGLISTSAYGEKLYQTIGRITGTLKATAKQARIPIVLLCQLNRDSAKSNRAPELFDLRDSGSIEQDADIVLMLQDTDTGDTNMWLRKNRQGRKDVGIVIGHNTTFTNFFDKGIIDD